MNSKKRITKIANIIKNLDNMKMSKKIEYATVQNNELVLAAELYEVDKVWDKINNKFNSPIEFNEEGFSELEATILNDVSSYKIDTDKGQYVVENIDKMKAMFVIAKQDKRLAQLSDLELGNILRKRI